MAGILMNAIDDVHAKFQSTKMKDVKNILNQFGPLMDTDRIFRMLNLGLRIKSTAVCVLTYSSSRFSLFARTYTSRTIICR
jgi:hypothetical protein